MPSTEWRLYHEPSGEHFSLVVQRAKGKTPLQLYNEVRSEAEIERAISDFWEAESQRFRNQPLLSHYQAYRDEVNDLLEHWDGSVGEPPPRQRSWVNEPPIVWWHAHRRPK